MRRLLCTLVALAACSVAATADEPATPAPPTPPDAGKRLIEAPVERNVLETSEGPAPETARPGLVRWHAGPKEAFAAANRSGRPVVLFQLLGNLDEEFC